MHTYKVNEITQALLETSPVDQKVCHRTPTNVEHNCTFLVDQSKLKLQSDLKVDDCGSWKNNGVRCVIISVDGERTTVIAQEKESKTYKIRKGQFFLLTLPTGQVKILGKSSLHFLVTAYNCILAN